jgi:hypothetical protein
MRLLSRRGSGEIKSYSPVIRAAPGMDHGTLSNHKESGIRNDPNDWARERNQHRYILDLIKRIVRVSLETMKIVEALPALNDRKD